MVVCPWHAWEFDCRSGEFDYNPEVKVRKLPVVLRGEEVFVDAGTA
jgi:nitrite reductase/ring-hydroxylating ferredoxin subunit